MENTTKTATEKTKSTSEVQPSATDSKSLADKAAKANDWSKREIGALWKRKSTTQVYLSGHVTLGFDEKYKIMIFTNKSKTGDKHPDYRVYLQDSPEEFSETKSAAKNAASKSADKITPSESKASAQDEIL